MGALRSFQAYTNVAPVSPSVFVDVARSITQQCLFPCQLVNLDGVVAAAGFLQIFDSAVAPQVNDVPLKSFQVLAAGPLPSLYSLFPITLANGFYVAMSSTEASYTAVATNFDVWGELEEFEGVGQNPNILSVRGDLTTGTNKLAASGLFNGHNFLIQVDVINGTGAAAWLFVMAIASTAVINGVKPIVAIPLANVATAQTFKFGVGGLRIFSQDASFTQRQAITLAVSTTGDVMTIPAGSTNKIRAIVI